jgi:hypothetical protein
MSAISSFLRRPSCRLADGDVAQIVAEVFQESAFFVVSGFTVAGFVGQKRNVDRDSRVQPIDRPAMG